MPGLLPPNSAARLALVLAMLGSDYAGERAAAGHLADQMVREAGLSWTDVIAAAPTDRAPWRGLAEKNPFPRAMPINGNPISAETSCGAGAAPA